MDQFKIFGKDGSSAINNIKEWEQFGAPASEIHWKPGRSAHEFASSWLKEGTAKSLLHDMLTKRFKNKSISLLKGFAEYESRFFDTGSGPRNHDLFVEAKIDDKPIAIGIEGKEREAYGDTIADTRAKALKSSANSKSPDRINTFCKVIFGEPYEGNEAKYGHLRYQFLSGVAGTLVEAQKLGTDTAVFLIQQLKSDKHTPQKDLDRNESDLQLFLSAIDLSKKSTSSNFLIGPHKTYGNALMPRFDVYIGKIEVEFNA